jgi:hypothetical protein
MRRLIVAYTPYHALLATAVLQKSTEENHLVIVRDFGGAEDLAAVLGRAAAGAYVTAAALGGCLGSITRLQRQFSYRRSAVQIERRAGEIVPDEIWLGNDARPESHAAFRAAGGRGPRPSGVLVEDGMTAYAAGVNRPLTFWEQAAGRMLFGRLWCGISVLGTSPLVSKGLFIHPSLVRKELGHLAKSAIPRDALFTPAMWSLAEAVIRKAGAEPEHIARLSAVVTATHSSVAERSRDYRPRMAEIVRQLVESGYNVAVKYHPRQTEPDFLDVARDPRVMLLPPGLPLEYVYVCASGRPGAGNAGRPLQLVIGDVSTTLLTARWLLPDARVVSVGGPLGLVDRSIEELFVKLGISVPARLESLC